MFMSDKPEHIPLSTTPHEALMRLATTTATLSMIYQSPLVESLRKSQMRRLAEKGYGEWNISQFSAN